MSRFDNLTKYRVEGDEGVHPEQPAPLAPVKHGTFLCFDQALARTGWVVMDVTDEGWIVLDSGVHTTTPEAKTSLEDSYARGELLNAMVAAQLVQLGDVIDHVLYEMPVVGPRKTRNAEAAHVAVMAVRIACGWQDVPSTMVNVQQARKRLTGTAKADKKDVRAVVEQHCALHHMPYQNADTFDAAGLGLAHTLADD